MLQYVPIIGLGLSLFSLATLCTFMFKTVTEESPPYLVHMIRSRDDEASGPQLSGVELLCLKTAHLYHTRVILHTNSISIANLTEQLDTESPHLLVAGRLRLRHLETDSPAGLLARLKILREYGGIIVDSNVYLLRRVERDRSGEGGLLVGLGRGGDAEGGLLMADRGNALVERWIRRHRGWKEPFEPSPPREATVLDSAVLPMFSDKIVVDRPINPDKILALKIIS